MKNQSNPENLFKDQILNPKSQGERDQVEKIKKLSEDPNEIIQFKKDLLNTKEKFQQDEKEDDSQKNGDTFEYREPIKKKPAYRRRKADKKVFTQQKPKFFPTLMNFLSLISVFRNKYPDQKKVRFGFINYFANGSFFYPDSDVFRFAQREIIPLQDILKPFIKKIYKWGWCDIQGKRILDPYGFNLISEFERFLEKKHIENIISYQNSPDKCLEVLNSFIKYYYTIIDTAENYHLLLINIKRILTMMMEAEVKDITVENIRLINRLLDEIDSKKIEEEFLLPIFESYLGRPIVKSEIQDYISLDPISSSEYYADPRLMSSMKVKEEKFEKYLSQKVKTVRETLDLIEVIKNDLSFRIERGKGHFFSLIDHAVSKKYSSYKGFPNLENLLPHQKTFFATLQFVDTYDSFLAKDLKVKKDMADSKVIDIRLFEDSVFESELEYLFNSTEHLKRIAEKPYRGDIFSPSVEEKDISKEHKIHLATLNSIADMFFSIGDKLNRYLMCSGKCKEDSRPLTMPELGSLISPYHDHLIHQIPSKKDFREGYYFFQKGIKEVLKEIRAFCFQYVYFFEFQYRKFMVNDNRRKTLKRLISEKSVIEKSLKKLESGEDIDI